MRRRLKRREWGEKVNGGGRGGQDKRGKQAVEVSKDREAREVGEGDCGSDSKKIKATFVWCWHH